LLRRTGISFVVDPRRCSEHTELDQPDEHAGALALRKARDVAARHPEAVIIGADTVIDLDGEILGKPKSVSDAERMLSRLAGRYHRLVTGLAVIDAVTGLEYSGVEITMVHLRDLTASQIRAYAASGEPEGKSGAYEIQGLGATIIDRIEGDFSNVVGLPMAHLAIALERFGIDVLT
jgi:septum formation protein